MKEITKNMKVYVTDDGFEFTDKKEALNHEAEVKYTKYYSVAYNFDTTEGRCYNNIAYYAVKATYCHIDYLAMFCNKKYGNYVWIMGYQPVKAYSINLCKDTHQEFIKLDFTGINYENIEDYITKKII